MNVLKTSVKAAVEERMKIETIQQKDPKIQIIGMHNEEMEEEEKILDAIIKQNNIDTRRKGFKMKILKRQKVGKEEKNTGKLILEVDVESHKTLISTGKINIGWNKCRIYDFVSVMRYFNCRGFHHVAKYCKKEERCNQCVCGKSQYETM